MALRNYLAERRIRIETQLKELRAELGEIRIAEAALDGLPTGRLPVITSRGQPAAVREGSIKDWILKTLTASETGLETEGVMEAVEKAGGPTVPRSSMTPQLSRLKSIGLIAQEGRSWRLAPRNVQNNETPGVQPPDVPEDEAEVSSWTIHPSPSTTDE